MDTPPSAGGAPVLGRRERAALFVHRTLDKRLSPLGVWVMRRTRGRPAALFQVRALVLTTRGRRTGRDRSVVLQYFPDGAAMVVIAANDGGEGNPGWYFNLVACPDAVVEAEGRRVDVHAVELGPDETARWWQRILRTSPDYQRYRRATARRFPIIRLSPVVHA